MKQYNDKNENETISNDTANEKNNSISGGGDVSRVNFDRLVIGIIICVAMLIAAKLFGM